jgi:hypothetical protein
MAKPKGGRGNKALYESTHVRVPEPIKPEVERLIGLFHEPDEPQENPLTNLEEVIVLAKAILLQKKSAKASIEKLLTAIYRQKISL